MEIKETSRKHMISLKSETILGFLFALYGFFKLMPYFLWETFNNGVYERLFGGFQTTNVLAVIILFLSVWELVKRIKVPVNDYGLMALVMVSGFIIIYISGRDNIMSRVWINYITLSMFLLSSENVKNKSFRFFKYIFTITLIPAILWYIFTNLLGVSATHTTITPINKTKVALEYSYRHYLGAVQLFGRWDPSAHFRFNGLYDEPGVVGSIAGLLLSTNLLKKEKETFINILLIIEGLLSLSLAFFLLILIYYVVSNLISGRIKGPIVIIGLIILYIVFINIHFSNDVLATFQARFNITSTGLAGDNRTSELFDSLYLQFKQSSDTIVILFGNGPDAIETLEGKSCSFRNIIYDYGYVVFTLFISFIVLYIFSHRKNGKKAQLIILLLLTLANVYQRAGLFYFPYMLILIGGVAFLQVEYAKPAVKTKAYSTRGITLSRRIKV